MPLHRCFISTVVVALVGFVTAVDHVAAADAAGAGQPSNRIGLVKDHDPVKYAGEVLYYVEDKLVGRDKLTQTWSIIERKEGKAEHAFRVETHAIHSDADSAKPSFVGRDNFKQQFEDSVRYELFHQTEDRSLVLDAIEGRDGKPEKLEVPGDHYIFPGTMKIGTKWLSEPVTSTLPGSCRFEVIGSEIHNGTNCWLVRSARDPVKNLLIPNSGTVSKTTRFLLDPETLTVLRITSVTEGLGPLGREFRFVSQLDVAK